MPHLWTESKTFSSCGWEERDGVEKGRAVEKGEEVMKEEVEVRERGRGWVRVVQHEDTHTT